MTKNLNFLLEDVEIIPSQNRMERGDTPVTVQPKVMEVLEYLATHHTRVVSKEELIDTLWDGRVSYASVQKSINLLRKALSEYFGDQEIITNFSKKGYQLTVKPEYTEASAEAAAKQESERKSRLFSGAVIVTSLLVVCGAFFYFLKLQSTSYIPNEIVHKSSFDTNIGFTNEIGHERFALPHPGSANIAYIREHIRTDENTKFLNELVIRDAKKQDWIVAQTDNEWHHIAWSPSGKQLLAIEAERTGLSPITPDFYSRPDYIYKWQLFDIDIANQRVTSQQTISRWQGFIASATWFNDTTIEVIARQGGSTSHIRFHYSTLGNSIYAFDPLRPGSQPIVASSFDGVSATASMRGENLELDFLGLNQEIIQTFNLPSDNITLSWVPDKSGVLIYAGADYLKLLYLDGSEKTIPISIAKDKMVSSPHFDHDGQSIYYTESILRSNIFKQTTSKSIVNITNNSMWNYAAKLFNQSANLVYASVRNNNHSLWLVSGKEESQLTQSPLSRPIEKIILTESDSHVIYQSGNDIYIYSFEDKTEKLLSSTTEDDAPVAFYPERNELYITKRKNNTVNLWRIDFNSLIVRQITFGELGSVMPGDENIYFQYVDKEGLWKVTPNDSSPVAVSDSLERNSHLLSIKKNTVYYVTGGKCRESAIKSFNIDKQVSKTALNRSSSYVTTTSFDPKHGALYTPCSVPESNIMTLK